MRIKWGRVSSDCLAVLWSAFKAGLKFYFFTFTGETQSREHNTITVCGTPACHIMFVRVFFNFVGKTLKHFSLSPRQNVSLHPKAPSQEKWSDFLYKCILTVSWGLNLRIKLILTTSNHFPDSLQLKELCKKKTEHPKCLATYFLQYHCHNSLCMYYIIFGLCIYLKLRSNQWVISHSLLHNTGQKNFIQAFIYWT